MCVRHAFMSTQMNVYVYSFCNLVKSQVIWLQLLESFNTWGVHELGYLFFLYFSISVIKGHLYSWKVPLTMWLTAGQGRTIQGRTCFRPGFLDGAGVIWLSRSAASSSAPVLFFFFFPLGLSLQSCVSLDSKATHSASMPETFCKA